MPVERPPDLFDAAAAEELSSRAPLATRMRPTKLDEVIGQSHLLSKEAPFRRLVESDRLSSAVFFGPPGTGKTTVARLVAESTEKAFVSLSAVEVGVREVREVLERSRRALGESGRHTILFLDEIHRFSRSQQDALLPGVEEGVIALIGATTENPFFSLNAPLLSRSTLWRFEPLSKDELCLVVERAARFEGASITDEALNVCCGLAEGDARAALTTFEIALAMAVPSGSPRSGGAHVEPVHVEAARRTRALRYSDDDHYDMASVFIKSIRGSDPDAGVYWLARLLKVGEDPRFIARRLVILASEDIGMADPTALVVANAAAQALDRVGLPEAALNLAEAVIHLSTSPKSNRVARAIWTAQQDVESLPAGAVPAHMRDAHYRGAALLGHGEGYEYPHDSETGYVEAQYLPDELVEKRYYEPTDRGFEREVGVRLARWRSSHENRKSDETTQSDGDRAKEVER